MADQLGLKKDPEEVKTQVEAEPTSDKKEPVSEVGIPPVVEPKGEPKPTVTEGELPGGVSERTREQFDKLKDSNQRLLEANKLLQGELTKRYQTERTFAPIQQATQMGPQPVVQPQGVQAPQVEQFVEIDPVTGEQYVNEAKLQTAIANANARAVRAETAVRNYIQQQQAVEDDRQTREAYTAHPELNPNAENFDKGLHRRTRALLLDSMMNPVDYDGHALSFKEAADFANEQTTKEATELEKKVEGQRQESIEKKEQASLAAQGQTGVQPPPAEVSEELADLIRRTRAGDPWALAQRLKNTPHTGTPTSSEEIKGPEGEK